MRQFFSCKTQGQRIVPASSIQSIIHHFSRLVCLVLIVSAVAPVQAQLALQPAGKHSSLVTTDKKTIRDDEFAQLMKGLLINGGNKNAKDAKFVFQQCFGGGMLDDIKNALGTTVSWVGGSASRWDQVSWGEEKPPQDWWTAALAPELNKNQTLLKSLQNARAQDVVGINGQKREEGQATSANGGQNITLKDPAAVSHHAILWAGLVNGNRFATDISRVNNALQNAWAGTNFTIATFFGNGTAPGTMKADKATLTDYINKTLKPLMDKDEQFFFYASDHGSSNFQPTNLPKRVPGRSNDLEDFDLEDGELLGIQLDPDNQPTITVDYEDLTVASPVMFNGTLIGTLDPLLSEMTFDIPESLIGLDNVVEIDNLGSNDFTLDSKDFSTGPIGTQIADVPEPGAVAMLVSGMVMFGGMKAKLQRRK